MIKLICGSISNILAAQVSERWTRQDKAAKGYVVAIMSFLAAVFAFLVFWDFGFILSLVFYAVYFIVADGYLAPVLSMLAIAAPPHAKG